MWWTYELLFLLVLLVSHHLDGRCGSYRTLTSSRVFPGGLQAGGEGKHGWGSELEHEQDQQHKQDEQDGKHEQHKQQHEQDEIRRGRKEEKGGVEIRVGKGDGKAERSLDDAEESLNQEESWNPEEGEKEASLNQEESLNEEEEGEKQEEEVEGRQRETDDSGWGWEGQEGSSRGEWDEHISSDWADDSTWTLPSSHPQPVGSTKTKTSSSAERDRSGSRVRKAFCYPCHRVFPHDAALRQHDTVVHPDGLVPVRSSSVEGDSQQATACDVCHQMFSLRFNLREHKKAEHPWSLLCSTHIVSFPNAHMALQHYQTQHGCKDVPASRIQQVLDELKATPPRPAPHPPTKLVMSAEYDQTLATTDALDSRGAALSGHISSRAASLADFPSLPIAPATVLAPKRMVDEFDPFTAYEQIDVGQDLPSFDFPDGSGIPSSNKSDSHSLSEQSTGDTASSLAHIGGSPLSSEHTGGESAGANLPEIDKMYVRNGVYQVNLAAVQRMVGDHSASHGLHNQPSRPLSWKNDQGQTARSPVEPTRHDKHNPFHRGAAFLDWMAYENTQIPSFDMPDHGKPFTPYGGEPNESNMHTLPPNTIPAHSRARPTPRVAPIQAPVRVRPPFNVVWTAAPATQIATLKDIANAKQGKVKVPKSVLVPTVPAVEPIFESGWTQVPTTAAVSKRSMGGRPRIMDDGWAPVAPPATRVMVAGEEDPYGGW